EERLPGNLNLSFAYVQGEALLMALRDVAVSSGSACTSASVEPGYVLRAVGLGDGLAHSSLRFCLGRVHTAEEVDCGVGEEGRPGLGDGARPPVSVRARSVSEGEVVALAYATGSE